MAFIRAYIAKPCKLGHPVLLSSKDLGLELVYCMCFLSIANLSMVASIKADGRSCKDFDLPTYCCCAGS
jgi:hypothetical protein